MTTPLPDPELAAFVDALPKVELHVHLEGSVAPSTLLQLAQRHDTTSLPRSLDELRDFYRFRDFGHFVEVYYAICDNLRDEEDFALVAREVAENLAAQGVRYAEITFTPYNHVRRGVPADVVFSGVERGRKEAESSSGIVVRWTTDVPGEFGPESAMATAEMVLEHRPEGVVAFGLGGPEVGVPRPQFAPAFEMARDAGLRSVPHAGETTGPQSIWDAITHLGADRIGHGVRCLEDRELVAHLRETQLPLEVCPTSNARLGVVTALEQHPLRQLVDEGLFVTLNSDDPPMFATSLREEYLAALTVLGFSPTEVADLARAGVRAAFLEDHEDLREDLLAGIDAVPIPE